MSLLLRPPLPPNELPQITLATAVSVVRALSRAVGVTPGIKWPNDLILNGKKLGGILTEMETESDQIRYLVVGMGLNVNMAEFPPELAGRATSLLKEEGRSFSRLTVLQAWLEEFEILYRQFLSRGFPEILEEWKRHSVTLGKYVAVRQGPRQIEGLAMEVSPGRGPGPGDRPGRRSEGDLGGDHPGVRGPAARPLIPGRSHRVAQAFQPVQPRLRPGAIQNNALMATRYAAGRKTTPRHTVPHGMRPGMALKEVNDLTATQAGNYDFFFFFRSSISVFRRSTSSLYFSTSTSETLGGS